MPKSSPPRSLLVRATRSFKQRRAAATYEALLRAAVHVFAEKGYEATQTPDIAAAAGVSTGAFYRYFDDKKQIFLEMLVGHLERGRADVRERLTPERFAGKDSRMAIAVVIDVLFEVVRRDAAIHRVFLSMAMSDPDVAQVRVEYLAEERASLAELIGALIPKSVVPSPLAAASIIQVAGLEVALEASGLRSRRGERASDVDLKQALGDMFHRYLFPVVGRARKAR